MARTSPDKVHVTYPTPTGPDMARVSGSELDDIRVHGSKDAALEFAVDHGQKYVPVAKGETITQAIARYTAERARATAGRPVAERAGVKP